MQEEPTANRFPDVGGRALFAEAPPHQAWLDLQAALAQAQAELANRALPCRPGGGPP
jgi:adenylosuccinate lyase